MEPDPTQEPKAPSTVRHAYHQDLYTPVSIQPGRAA